MEHLFICYTRCGTCRKAKAWLEENNINFEFRDIKGDNPTEEELTEWYHKSDYLLKRFFNTSGQVYKQLKLKDKLATMSEEEQIKLLATNGMLVKRPILVADDTVLVGFKEDEWQVLL